MSTQGGEFSAVNEIIDLHYQLHRLGYLLDCAIGRSGVTLQQTDIAAAEAAAMAHVQRKFPQLGIARR